MDRRRGTGSAALAVAGLLLSACSPAVEPPGTEHPPRPAPTVAAPLAAQCPRDGEGYLAPSHDIDVYAGSAMPEGFQPVSMVRCTSAPLPSDRGDRHLVTEATAPITSPLLEALSLPDLTWLPPRAACPANFVPVTPLLLVDSSGRAHRPRIPITPCHNPREGVDRAVAAAAWATVRVFEVTRPA